MDTFLYDTGHRTPVSYAATHLDQLTADQLQPLQQSHLQQQQQQQHQRQLLSDYPTSGMPPVAMEQDQQAPAESQHCGICGDRATGKHYGAYSCDGCKGFFRRSVRKSHQYQCRFSRVCTVDKDKRNQCRYCRLEKCFKAGMRKEAVQNERDKISFRKAASLEETPAAANHPATAAASASASATAAAASGSLATDFSISRIVSAEERNQQPQQFHTPQAAGFPQGGQAPKARSEASVATICDSMQHQLLLLVEWAKSFPAFIELKVEEQVALLRAHAGEILILGVTYRSRCEPAILVLGNSYRVSSNNPDKYMAQVAARIINELVSQFRDLELDFTEYACLKAVVFFDPDAVHLPYNVSRLVRRWRHEVLQRMQDYMSGQQYKSRTRFGELLLLLPKLQSINHEMIRKVYSTKMEGLARIDALLQELLLADNAEGTAAEGATPIGPGSQPMKPAEPVQSYSIAPTGGELVNSQTLHQQQQQQQHYQNGSQESYSSHYAAAQQDFLMSYADVPAARGGAETAQACPYVTLDSMSASSVSGSGPALFTTAGGAAGAAAAAAAAAAGSSGVPGFRCFPVGAELGTGGGYKQEL